VGDKVDVRSLDYVWCTGTIKLIIEQINRDPLLVIHKEGFANEWDELLYRNSPRVAVYGSYTKIQIALIKGKTMSEKSQKLSTTLSSKEEQVDRLSNRLRRKKMKRWRALRSS
jgi:hypothetical protein